jgi:hypothetical protein
MSRHIAVLRQFLDDADRLQKEVDGAFRELHAEAEREKYDLGKISQEAILMLYRPIHSLKSITSMVDEGKPLTKVFHEFENTLPPLLKGVPWVLKNPKESFERLDSLLAWSRRYLDVVREKLLLCYKLGVELRGEVGIFTEIQNEKVWIHLSLIQGLFSPDEAPPLGTQWTIGDQRKASFGLVVLDESGSSGVVWIPNLVQIYDRKHALDREQAKEFSQWLLSRKRAA